MKPAQAKAEAQARTGIPGAATRFVPAVALALILVSVAGCRREAEPTPAGQGEANNGARTPASQEATWSSLFNGNDLTGWVEIGSDGAWSVQEGILRCNGRKTGYAWLSTDRKFGDFELALEWRIEPGTNAGIFLLAPDREGRTSQKGCEVQIKDDREDPDLSDVSGAVFKRIPAAGKFAKPPASGTASRSPSLIASCGSNSTATSSPTAASTRSSRRTTRGA